MHILVCYDVQTVTKEGRRRLRRIAKLCQNHGQRVQLSLFECDLDPASWVALRAKLLKEISKNEDSIRFYLLGSNWKRRVEHHGAKKPLDMDGPLVF